MSAVNPDTPEGVTTQPSLADTLREVADWLDAHPEVAASNAHVWVRATERGDLEALARALGDRASEKASDRSVEIDGTFGAEKSWEGVSVGGSLPIEKLVDAPPVPQYEPIIPPKAEPAASDDWSAKRGEQA